MLVVHNKTIYKTYLPSLMFWTLEPKPLYLWLRSTGFNLKHENMSIDGMQAWIQRWLDNQMEKSTKCQSEQQQLKDTTEN